MEVPKDMTLDKLLAKTDIPPPFIERLKGKDPKTISKLPAVASFVINHYIDEEHRLGPQEESHLGWIMYQFAEIVRESSGIDEALQFYDEARSAFSYSRGHTTTTHRMVLEINQHCALRKYFRRFREAALEYANIQLSEGLLKEFPELKIFKEMANQTLAEV